MPNPFVLTAQRRSMAAEEWLNTTSPPAAFGHLRVPASELNLPQRARNLIRMALKQATVEQEHRILYVVPDRTEQRLLAEELKDSLDQADVVDYTTLFASLRSGNFRESFRQSRLVVLAEVDMHYSAQFALCMLELMASVRDGAPQSAAVMRVVTVSLRGPEESLDQALRTVCPSLGWPCLLHLEEPQSTSKPLRVDWGGEFVPAVLPHIEKALANGQSVIVLCDENEQDNLTTALEARRILEITFNELGKAVEIGVACRLLQDHRPGVAQPRPMLLFMTGWSRLAAIIAELGLVVVSNRHRSNVWDRGHVVAKSVPYSAWELEQAEAYAFQSTMPPHKVTVLVPRFGVPGATDTPCRRLEGDQALAFMYQIMDTCQGLSLEDLASCFVTDKCLMMVTLSQLLAMRCIRRRTPDESVPRGLDLVRGARARLMLQLLPGFCYSFHPAWFLSAVADGQAINDSTARAMARMAAIFHIGFDVIHRYRPAQVANERGVSIPDAMALVSTALGSACAMPVHIFGHGTFWVALAAWQKGAAMFDNYEGVDEAAPESWGKDVTDGKGLLVVNTMYGKLIAGLVGKLEASLSLPANPGPRAHKLVLTEACCNRILDALLGTWMHHAIFLRLMPSERADPQPVLTDMVGTEVESVLAANGDLLVLNTALGSPGTKEKCLWAVSLFLKRMECQGQGILLLRELVVMPFERIQAWKTVHEDVSFAELIRCDYHE